MTVATDMIRNGVDTEKMFARQERCAPCHQWPGGSEHATG
jgi:hypothetical protein